MGPTTQLKPLEFAPDGPPQLSYVLSGQIRITGGQLICTACNLQTGPWLLAVTAGTATMTCPCGFRGHHPQLTPEIVYDRADHGHRLVHASLADAETSFLASRQ